MATILITGDDAAKTGVLQAMIESLGHVVIHSETTENVIEDVLLNNVGLVIAEESTVPFNGWEVCTLLRADPAIAPELPILFAPSNDLNPRRFKNSGFSGLLDVDLPAEYLREEIVRQLKDFAAPETSTPLARSSPEKRGAVSPQGKTPPPRTRRSKTR